MQAVQLRVAHCDGVTGPCQSGTQEQNVAYVLPRPESTARGPDNREGAEHDENKTNVFPWRKGFSQYDRRQQRHHKRHHTGEQRAAVRCWCEQQASIHKNHHRRTTPERDSRKSNPA